MLSLNSHFVKLSHLLLVQGGNKRTNPCSYVVYAAGKDSDEFKIDPDEAKKALQNLDQQFRTISTKQPSTPKIRGNSFSSSLASSNFYFSICFAAKF